MQSLTRTIKGDHREIGKVFGKLVMMLKIKEALKVGQFPE